MTTWLTKPVAVCGPRAAGVCECECQGQEFYSDSLGLIEVWFLLRKLLFQLEVFTLIYYSVVS